MNCDNIIIIWVKLEKIFIFSLCNTGSNDLEFSFVFFDEIV